MTIKNLRKNISAEPGDIVIDITQNTLNKSNNDANFSNDVELTIKQHDYINENNTTHTKKLTIPISEVVRLAYLVKNYYDKTTSDTRFAVTVAKQDTAESGSAVTYVIKQNGNQVGTKINIPKDFLVRSATLKTVSTKNQPVSGYNIGDKYIDFVINTSDSSESDQHIYLNVKDLVDVYTADESTLTVSNNKFSIKPGGITSEQLGSSLQTLINSKIDTAGTGLRKDGTKLHVNYSSAIDSTSENVAATPKAVNDALFAAKSYTDQEILGILDPNGVVRLEIAEKANAQHSHGNITYDGKLGTSNAIVTTNSENKIVASATISKSKISDFAHDQASSTITNTSAFNNIKDGESTTVTLNTQSKINDAINTKLGKKVDKETGKGLSTNDFTNDLKTKLNGIDVGANKYVHHTQSAITGKPTQNQSPTFGSAFTISQVSVNTEGHVTGLTDRDITIPGTEASANGKGLMSKDMFNKLKGIEAEANKYIHHTQSAITGKPTEDKTPGFGSPFEISQAVVDTEGHVTNLATRKIYMPETTATNTTFGLSKVIDNLTTTTHSNGVALSAHQGQVLDDSKWTKAPTNVTENINFDAYKTPGTYKIWAAQEATNDNAPDTQGGLLFVHEIPNGYLQVLVQYYVDKPKTFYRTYHSSAGWRKWQTILTSGTNNIEEKTLGTNETVVLNYDTGMGIYSKWQGSTSISANDWWDFRTFPNFGPNNDIEIETIGVSYATNNITAGVSRDKIMYARIKNNKVSFFPAENTAGQIYYGAFSIPFQFRIK